MKEVKGYETSDGSFFEDEEKAREHEGRIILKEALRSWIYKHSKGKFKHSKHLDEIVRNMVNDDLSMKQFVETLSGQSY